MIILLYNKKDFSYAGQGLENSYIEDKRAYNNTENDIALGTIAIQIKIKTAFRLIPTNK